MSDNVFAEKLVLRFLSISGQRILLKYKEVQERPAGQLFLLASLEEVLSVSAKQTVTL